MKDDQRRHPRMPGNNQAAIIHHPQSALPVMCTVADISEGGAGLTLASISGIPDNFKLEIKGDAKVRACKVAWRKEPHRMGVAFESDSAG